MSVPPAVFTSEPVRPAMRALPAQASPEPVGRLAELLEGVIAVYETLPIIAWVIILVVVVVGVSRLVDRLDDRLEMPGDDTIDRRRERSSIPRERYSLHEDVDAWRREYTEPSESDGIRVTNEVDRSLLGKLRRLLSLRSAGGNERD